MWKNHFQNPFLHRWIVLIAVATILFYALLTVVILLHQQIPLFSDEYVYNLDMRNYLMNKIYSSSMTLDASYSRYGNFSFHGFSYTLLYGILGSAMQTNSILHINVFFSIVTILFVFSIKDLTIERRILVVGIFVTYFVFLIYNLSFMVESVHFFGAVIVTYLLYKFFNCGQKRYLFAFLVALVPLVLLRQTWIFFIFSLFFKPNIQRKDIIKYLLIVFILLLLAMVEIYLFHANYPNSFIHRLTSQETLADIHNLFIKHALYNIDSYFKKSNLDFYFYTKIILILLWLYTCTIGILHRNRFILAISLVGFLYFSSLIFLYDAWGWREHRVLSVVYISLIIALALTKNKKVLTALFLVQLVLFPKVVSYYRESRLEDYLSKSEKMNLLNEKIIEILRALPNKGMPQITVSFDRNVIPLDRNCLLSALPLKTIENVPIRYNVYYFKSFADHSEFGDYILSKRKYSDLHLFKNVGEYFLYKTKRRSE